MQNPFDDVSRQIYEVRKLLLEVLQRPVEKREEEQFVTEEELCKRFNISRPTARKFAKEKKIKVLRFGSSKRYRWSEVLQKLDK